MKGNSQRVPGKNFKNLGGKPLFDWMLDTLLAIEVIEQIIINTDASELLDNPRLQSNQKILLRERPQELRGDAVSMNAIIASDVEWTSGDFFLMTHSTNPFIRPSTVEKALEKFDRETSSGKFDSLFSVNRFQTRFYQGDGLPINHDPNNLVQTQDLEPWFEENSCLYVFSRESFKRTGARIGEKPVLFETPKIESIDIDTTEDWEMAELVASMVKIKERSR